MKGLSRPGVREKIAVHPRGVGLRQISLNPESFSGVVAAAIAGSGPHPDTHVILVAQNNVGVGQAAVER